MISIHAHFNGTVIVPDDPVDLPRDQALIIRIEPVGQSGPPDEESCLDWLAEHAVDSADLPTDLSLQHAGGVLRGRIVPDCSYSRIGVHWPPRVNLRIEPQS